MEWMKGVFPQAGVSLHFLCKDNVLCHSGLFAQSIAALLRGFPEPVQPSAPRQPLGSLAVHRTVTETLSNNSV